MNTAEVARVKAAPAATRKKENMTAMANFLETQRKRVAAVQGTNQRMMKSTGGPLAKPPIMPMRNAITTLMRNPVTI